MASPSNKLVRRELEDETAGVDYPTKDRLGFFRCSFGFHLGKREHERTWEGLLRVEGTGQGAEENRDGPNHSADVILECRGTSEIVVDEVVGEPVIVGFDGDREG